MLQDVAIRRNKSTLMLVRAFNHRKLVATTNYESTADGLLLQRHQFKSCGTGHIVSPTLKQVHYTLAVYNAFLTI